MEVDLNLYGQNDSKQQLTNMQEMFESLFFNLNLELLMKRLTNKSTQPDILHGRIKSMVELHLDNTTDVLIQVMSQLFKDTDASNRSEEKTQLFVSIWFSFLKVQLKFVERLKDVAPCVRNNLSRAIEFLISEELLTKESTLWNESWEVIGSFFPGMKKRMSEPKMN